MAEEIIERTAIHEAGQVIIAYYLNYNCNYTDCSKSVPGEGKTVVSWLTNQQVINMILAPQLYPEEIKQSQNMDKDSLLSLLSQFIFVLSAGTAAQIIYDQENNRIPNNLINAADADYIGDFIEGIKLFGLVVDPSIVYKTFGVCLGLLRKEELWKFVKIIADEIILKPTLRLTGTEIESILITARFKSPTIIEQ
jgi:hypothetical protein